jgi:hypothetical protein
VYNIILPPTADQGKLSPFHLTALGLRNSTKPVFLALHFELHLFDIGPGDFIAVKAFV